LLEVSNTLNDKTIIQVHAHLGEQPNRVTDTLNYHLKNGEIVYSSRQEQNEKNGGNDHFNVLKSVPSDTEGIGKIIDAISVEQWAWVDVHFGVGTPLNSYTEEQIKELWFKGLFKLQKYASGHIDS
jgi:hypothetical protein